MIFRQDEAKCTEQAGPLLMQCLWFVQLQLPYGWPHSQTFVFHTFISHHWHRQVSENHRFVLREAPTVIQLLRYHKFNILRESSEMIQCGRRNAPRNVGREVEVHNGIDDLRDVFHELNRIIFIFLLGSSVNRSLCFGCLTYKLP
jgi:hypothetical protein